MELYLDHTHEDSTQITDAHENITFNETFEYKYLFHLAVFDDTTME